MSVQKFVLTIVVCFVCAPAFAQFSPSSVDPNDTYHLAGQVGIGLSDPKAKLDIRATPSYPYTDESILRVTYPWPSVSGGNPIPVLKSIFEIRQGSNPQFQPLTFTTRFVVMENGNAGIGVPLSDPGLDNVRLTVTDDNVNLIDLNVRGFALVDGKNASLLLGRNDGAPFGQWGIEYNEYATEPGLNFWKPFGSNNYSNYLLYITDGGKVSIGLDPNDPNTFNGDYKLYVAEGILTERVKVALRSSIEWADYVFDEDYELMPIGEVEEFILENGHLPNVPSAEEVVESGIDMAKMDAKLLEKIEELSLYVIQLKKENEELAARLEALESR